MLKKLNSRERAACLFCDLRSRIEDGFFSPGSLLPSESHLCADYDLSRPTIRRVLQKLSHLHLIEKKPGIGTFVKDPTQEAPLPIFRIGVDFFDTGHYCKSIWTGLSNSPFGRNCYFHLLDKDKLHQGILDNDVDGILLYGFDGDASVLEKLKDTGKPLLVINRRIENPGGTAYVTVDHRKEMAFAVTHLFRYGHRKVAFVGDCQFSGAIRLRHAGWLDAYRQEGLPTPVDLQFETAGYMQADFSRELQQFLLRHDFPALVFANALAYQRLCPELCRLTSQLQYQPQIIVFDDVSSLPESRVVPCSYVRMPLENLGAVAAEFLRQKEAQPRLPPTQKILPCSLVIRHTQDLQKESFAGLGDNVLEQQNQFQQSETHDAKSIEIEFSR